jgi:transcriptional antiterminator Rof (Rho-off)
MSAETLKYTREQVETLEVAPGFKHENLEGWVPELANETELRDALEKAFDYRGDITITLKSGERFEAYVFNRRTGATLAESWVQYFAPNVEAKQKLAYDQIARLEFTGKGLQRAQSSGRKRHCAGARRAGVADGSVARSRSCTWCSRPRYRPQVAGYCGCRERHLHLCRLSCCVD